MRRYDLATFTFGGNDIVFSTFLEQCLGFCRLVANIEDASKSSFVPRRS